VESGPVAFVLARIVAIMFPDLEGAEIRNQGVMFLAPDEVPRAEYIGVVFAAEVEIMVMVGHQVRKDAIPFEDIRQGDIKRLDRGPVALEEIKPAGQKIMPGRHAGR